MIKNVLSDLGGVGLYGVISICIFFAFFTGALIWTFAQRKSLMNTMELLPLADDETPAQEGDSRHE